MSASRQAWINELRVLLAEYLAILFRLDARVRATGEEVNALERDLVEKQCSIELMLNPDEEDYRKLQELFSQGLKALNDQHKADEPRKLHQVMSSISEVARPILRREWKKVKSGD